MSPFFFLCPIIIHEKPLTETNQLSSYLCFHKKKNIWKKIGKQFVMGNSMKSTVKFAKRGMDVKIPL